MPFHTRWRHATQGKRKMDGVTEEYLYSENRFGMAQVKSEGGVILIDYPSLSDFINGHAVGCATVKHEMRRYIEETNRTIKELQAPWYKKLLGAE